MTDLAHRLHALTTAVENVLVAAHGIRSHLAADAPPFFIDAEREATPITVALRHYGPGALFDLWCACRALEQLRLVWTGASGATNGTGGMLEPPADVAAVAPVQASLEQTP